MIVSSLLLRATRCGSVWRPMAARSSSSSVAASSTATPSSSAPRCPSFASLLSARASPTTALLSTAALLHSSRRAASSSSSSSSSASSASSSSSSSSPSASSSSSSSPPPPSSAPCAPPACDINELPGIGIRDVSQLWQRTSVPRPALVLGIVGLAPMVAGAAGAVLLRKSSMLWAGKLVFYQMTYGAVLLSFMGAVHFGLALVRSEATDDADAPHWRHFAASVLPCATAWLALSLRPDYGMLVLLSGFVWMWYADGVAAARRLVPRWYMRLRTPLTVGVVGCLLTSFLYMLAVPVLG